MIEKFYTPQEVADTLQINYRTVLDLIRFREIPAYQIGKQFRIAESEFNTYLNDNKVPELDFKLPKKH